MKLTFVFVVGKEKKMKKKLNKEEIKEIKNKPGIYKIFSCDNKLLYIGRSKILKHRLQSYYQKDDFTVNKTKKKLRKESCKFTFRYMTDKKARKIEKKLKTNVKFNFR